MSKKDGDYEVGYGKPPKAHQFKPGHSGNKKGRPKGSKGLKTDLKDVLQETLPLTINGKKQHVTKQKAMVMATITKAIKGDTKATNVVVGMILKLLPDELQDTGADELSKTDQEILEQFAETILKKAEKSNGVKS